MLAVVYLIFNEGYGPPPREELCEEAIRLGKVLAVLMPDEPEALGLLALMLLHDARRAARLDADGELVLLDDQDRSLWDAARIDEGRAVLDRALPLRQPGPYQLQAAIAVAPSRAARPTGRRSPRSTAGSRASRPRRWSSSTAPSRSPWPRGRSRASS